VGTKPIKAPARAVLVALLLFAGAAGAEVPAEYLRSLDAAARAGTPGFAGFSAARGAQWFASRHGTDWSCATCHTERPLASGRHATTGRAIEPLAPAANPQRLTDTAKIEKWFKRNCNDVLGRACTPAEKGDVIAWLTSLKQ
jgi:hypothetical protein